MWGSMFDFEMIEIFANFKTGAKKISIPTRFTRPNLNRMPVHLFQLMLWCIIDK